MAKVRRGRQSRRGRRVIRMHERGQVRLLRGEGRFPWPPGRTTGVERRWVQKVQVLLPPPRVCAQEKGLGGAAPFAPTLTHNHTTPARRTWWPTDDHRRELPAPRQPVRAALRLRPRPGRGGQNRAVLRPAVGSGHEVGCLVTGLEPEPGHQPNPRKKDSMTATTTDITYVIEKRKGQRVSCRGGCPSASQHCRSTGSTSTATVTTAAVHSRTGCAEHHNAKV